MRKKVSQVAIIGGGPAGCTAAIKLVRQGKKVAIFDVGKRPDLIVGESLIPAVMPIIRDLGVEDNIKGFSVVKPGASVWMSDTEEATGHYTRAGGNLPTYAYQVPRGQFDEVLMNAAEKEGVKIFNIRAKVERVGTTDRVRLADETLAETSGFFDGEPDFIIDATGRTRMFAKILDVTAKEGPRKDFALFAHVNQASMNPDGHVHMHRCEHGWSWRIPLHNRISVGVVASPQHLEKYGSTIEEQYDNFIKHEKGICKFTANSVRVSKVMKYNNYQLISDRMVGDGWAMAGDAAGFIDPVFSSGVYLAMKSGVELAKALEANTPESMMQYEKIWRRQLKGWQRMVNTWYNGRLFTLFRIGQDMMNNFVGRAMEPHMASQLIQIFTGGANDSIYCRNFLRFVTGPLIDSMKKIGMTTRDHKDLTVN